MILRPPTSYGRVIGEAVSPPASLLITLCLFLLLIACGTPTPYPDVAARTTSVRALYPAAMELAREWRADAYLTRAHTWFVPADDDRSEYASFIFRSPSTDLIALHLRYLGHTDSWHDEWLSIANQDPKRYPEIRETDWQVDSTQALDIAQQNGGAIFLGCAAGGDLYLRLDLRRQWMGRRSVTVWWVSYSQIILPPYPDLDSSPCLDWDVAVDALTGEVLEIR